MSVDPLVIEALIPAASRMFPTLAEVGDRLAIAGLNLAQATEVEFAGGIRAPVVAPVSDSEVLVDVPNGAPARRGDRALSERGRDDRT